MHGLPTSFIEGTLFAKLTFTSKYHNIVHHFFFQQKENKMTLQNVSIVLSPTMQISHRVLNVLFLHTKQIFANTVIKR